MKVDSSTRGPQMDKVGQVSPSREEQLRQIVAEALGKNVDFIDSNKSFLALGGDSLLAIKFLAGCRRRGIPLQISDVMTATTISELLEKIVEKDGGLGLPAGKALTAKTTPEQDLLLEMGLISTVVLQLKRDVDSASVQQALLDCANGYNATSARWPQYQRSFRQGTSSSGSLNFQLVVRTRDQENKTVRLNGSAPPTPVVNAVLSQTAQGSPLLSLEAPRASLDLASWRIIIRDLDQALGGLEPLETSNHHRNGRSNGNGNGNGNGLTHKSAIIHALGHETEMASADTSEGAAHLTFDLEMTEELLTGSCHAALRTDAMDLLVSALISSASAVGLDSSGLVEIQTVRSGRPQLPASVESQLVGCFDVLSGFRLETEPQEEEMELVRRSKDAARGFPKPSSTLGKSEEPTQTPEASFSILVEVTGIQQEPLYSGTLLEQKGLTQHRDGGPPSHSVVLITTLINGSLSCTFLFGNYLQKQVDASLFVRAFEDCLGRLLPALREKPFIPTLSDFPSLSLPLPELETLVKERLPQVASGHPLEGIEAIVPCSETQRNFLISQAVDPRRYYCFFALKLSSSAPQGITSQYIVSAWQRLISRHPMLRTVFLSLPQQQEKFVQVILREITPQMRILSSARPGDLEALQARKFPLLDQLKPQHLLTLIQNGEGEVYVRLDVSHALIDGHSAEVLLADLALICNEGTFIDEPLSYGRFVSYEQQMASSPSSKAYWAKYLGGAEPSFLGKRDMPPDAGGFETIKFQLGLAGKQMQKVCARYNVTQSSICQLAWGLVLNCLLQSRTVCFSYVASGRDAPLEGIESSVGPFISTLVCKLDFGEGVQVNQMLQIVVADLLQSLPHRFSKMDDGTAEPGSALKWGNTIVSFQRKISTNQPAGSDVRLDMLDAFSPADYAITVHVRAGDDDIDVSLDYWKTTIADDEIRLIAKLFRTALERVIESTDASVNDVSLLSAHDREKLLSWNRAPPPSLDACIHEKVYAQVETRPDAIAIHAWDGDLTYSSLWSKAERLAHHLASLGVGPEVKVGLCMDKSKLASVTMLAILQAGGVVAGLGTQHPMGRIKTILRDTGITTILVDAPQAKRLEGLAPNLINITEPWLATLPTQEGPACKTVTPKNAAWIIYTSGSTGEPKGVVLEHAALCTSSHAHGSKFDFGPHTRSVQFAAHTFDAVILDIFSTLIFGGCVCVMSEDDRMNNLANTMTKMGVNSAQITPTVALLLTPETVPPLKLLTLGGEPVPRALVERWINHAAVWNTYGPSESSILSTSNLITDPSENLNIGHPLAGCLWITEATDYHRLCPIGVVGELLLEGPLLGRGYLNNPEKTNESFVTDPDWVADLGIGPGRRFYRTGDLVRQNDDGSCTYIGRRDTQIKIRGQRVEVGEVEHQICQNETVRDAVVVYPQEGPSARKLVAFLTLKDFLVHGGKSSDIHEASEEARDFMRIESLNIQRQISSRLMSYMIPMLWIPLAALPLNPSGKIDRLRLTQWIAKADPSAINMFAPFDQAADNTDVPASIMEHNLQQIWGQVLNIPAAKISFNRSFLALGGDSVTAMQVVSRCRGQDILLSVKDVLQSQSIAQLAIQAKPLKSKVFEEVTSEPFSLSPVQQLYFRTIATAGVQNRESRYNQSVFVRLQRKVDSLELSRAIEALVAKHAMLRARVKLDSREGVRQVIESQLADSYRFSVHYIKENRSEVVSILEASQAALDFENGPVFSVDMIQTPESQLLYVVAHHLVVDLVSWRIIFNDLTELLEKHTLSVPRSMTFQTWCRLLEEHSQQKPEGLDVVLPFPVPVPDWEYWGLEKGVSLESSRVYQDVDLDEHLTSLLFGRSNTALKTEPVEILLAALFWSFRQAFPDRGTPAVFNEGHGREAWDESIDLSNTVGWFTTMTPIHVPSSMHSLIDALRFTKDRRRAIPSRGLPYFTARFQTAEGREAFKDHDFMEILFNYQGRYQQLETEDALFRLESVQNYDETALVSSMGANVAMLYVFDVGVTVAEGKTKISFGFSKQSKHQPAIKRWVEEYQQSLSGLIKTLETMEPMYTISDFPLADLTTDDLKLLSEKYLPQLGLSDLAAIEDLYPCTPVQEGILISQTKQPQSYQTRQICKINALGPSANVDTQRVAHAWQKVVDRHPILRTGFVELLLGRHIYHQVVLKSWQAEVEHITCSDERLQDEISALSRLERQGITPSHRLSIFRTDQGHVYAVLDISHTLCDASSIQLIVRDLSLAYDDQLPEAQGHPYSNYISYLQQSSGAEDKKYWKELLADAQPCHLPPPSTTPGTDASAHSVSRRITMELSQSDYSALRDFQATHDVTIASIFRMAWGLILSSYTSSNDVCFGYLINGRDVPVEGVQALVGPMINMMVCRIELEDDMKVSEAVKQIMSRFLEGFGHQRVSLAAIQHSIGLSDTPLFNTALSYRPGGGEDMGSGQSIAIEHSGGGDDATEYDVAVTVIAEKDKIQTMLEWKTTFMDEKNARKLLSGLGTVATRLASGRDKLLKELLLISNEDAAQIKTWNPTPPPALQTCIHDMVYAQQTKQPDAIAVHAWDGDLSYGSLWSQAEGLAHYLISLGVGPEVKVGFCMDKSKLASVSMLAILMAGGVVVAIGTQYPPARVEAVIRDTRLAVIIADQLHTDRLAERAPHLITISEQWVASLPSLGRVRTAVKPSNAAWIIYTSGSTGEPKGALLEHAALCTSFLAHGGRFGFGPHTRSVQFGAHTFDAVIFDVFTTLVHGGCVCVLSEEDRMNNLAPTMTKMRVNSAQLTPTVALLLGPDTVPTLKLLMLGGEPVPRAVVDRWMNDATVWNTYGPSECSILSSCNQITDPDQALNIGHALAGCSLWVTNATNYNRICPVGAVGELLIEGPIIGRGYLNDAKKTKATYANDPAWVAQLGLSAGRRMYRTGDLVQQNDDGSFTYVGRRDAQIKIRGQRVEIGEIEHHICQNAAIDDAVVVYPKKGPCADRLVALLTLKDFLVQSGKSSSIIQAGEEARARMRREAKNIQVHLGELILPYMIPTLWIPLAALPLNASGKTDRLQLTQWITAADPSILETYALFEDDEDMDEAASQLPLSAMERDLREIWGQVLNISPAKIKLNRSFLSLGGDSVTAMQVVSRCRGQSIMVSVKDVIQCQSIAQLAAQAKPMNALAVEDVTAEPFDLSPIQQFYFRAITTAGSHDIEENRHNQSVLVRLRKGTSASELARAMEALVEKHAMLRVRISHEASKGTFRQVIETSLHGSYRFQVNDIKRDEDVIDIINLSQNGLDFEHGPVFSVDMIQTSDGQLLYLNAHHLAVDLVSWRVMLYDLGELLEKQTLSVPRSLSFQSWSRLLANHSQHQLSPRQVLPFDVPASDWSYWGLEKGLSLEIDRVHEELYLDEDHTALLFGSSNDAMRTEPIEILIAALFWSFSENFPNREAPAVFNEGHGREPWDETIDLSNTVGWFTTMTPIHVPGASNESLIDVLRNTKDRRRAIPGRGLPYFSTRFQTSEGREAFGHHDFMEILINYQGRYQQLERPDALFQIEPPEKYRRNETMVPPLGSKVKMTSVFDVGVSVVSNKLRVQFGYNRHSRHQPAIKSWIDGYRRTLEDLVTTLPALKPVCTISDFPLAAITAKDLNTLEEQHLPQIGLVDLTSIEDIYPCSPIQEGILLSQIKDPAAYQTRQVCEIRGSGTALDAKKILQSWQLVVDRHPILRTGFVELLSGKDVFHQVVFLSWEAEVVQIACAGNDELQQQIQELARLERQGLRPSHRFTVLQIPGGNLTVVLDISHALCDASSIQLIVQDLVLAYEGRLPEAHGPPYSNYISYLQQDSGTEDRDYWKNVLEDAQPCHLPSQLATSDQASSLKNPPIQRVALELKDLSSLHDFQETHRVTLASIFQLAWGLTLSSYTGSNDVSFGYLTNGRDVPVKAVQELVGPMINMMACRILMDAETKVSTAVKQTMGSFLEGLNHQRISLATVQHAIGLSETPLFNTALSYKRGANNRAHDGSTLTVDTMSGDDATEYDVMMTVDAEKERIQIIMEWNTTFMDKKSADLLLSRFNGLVAQLVLNGERSLKELVLVSKEDLVQIKAWNQTVPPALRSCIHSVVHAQSEKRAEAVAVSSWDGNLTYHSLWQHVQRLAHHLVSLNVGPEVKVGFCMEKSKWAPVAMLAILAAGGVVVPLGTQHPLARLKTIIQDAGITIILVDHAQAGTLASTVPHILTISDSWLSSLPAKTGPACTSITPDNAAWIIYTSGSTGTPKGVVLEHKALCTSLQAHGVKMDLGPHTVGLQFSAYTFDMSIADTVGVLYHGGRTCIPSEADRLSRLAPFMAEQGVNFAMLTSSVAALLQPADIPSMETLALIGEAVKPEVVESWHRHVTVVNGYGPAECSINVSSNRITDPRNALNIGYPLAGRLWVVDATNYNRLCPIGGIGELLIEGPLLSRGYLNDATRTAAAFVNDPGWVAQLGLGPGCRMYRTGDLVRQNPNGSLVYIGRRDTQIKIRGQRVETGEIEYWVTRLLPGVRHATVNVLQHNRKGGAGKQVSLTVAMDFNQNTSVTSHSSGAGESPRLVPASRQLRKAFQKLRASLSEVLPSYMVPSVYVPMTRLPLNASGKLDRKAVGVFLNELTPAEVQSFFAEAETKIPPTTATEKQLQQLWAKALGIQPEVIGVNDHFFQLGGDSITAMRLAAASQAISLALTVTDIFQHPRLDDMARAMDQIGEKGPMNDQKIDPFALWEATESKAEKPQPLEERLEDIARQCDITPEQIEDVYPCTPLQEGLMAISAQQPRAYVAQRVFRLNSIDTERFEVALRELVQAAPILRTRIVASGHTTAHQVVVKEPFHWQRASSLADYLAADRESPMAYGRPLARWGLVEEHSSNEVKRYFVWTGHHSTYDGWSLQRMFQRVLEIYHGGDAIPSPVPFNRFVKHLVHNDQAAAQAYWRKELRGANFAQFPALPCLGYRPQATQVINRRLASRLQEQRSETLATILRASWAIVVSQHLGLDEALLAVTQSGRTAPVMGIADMLAPTITTVPVRVQIDPEQSVRDYLAQVQRQATEMIPYEHTGLQNIRRLVSELGDIDSGHVFMVQAPAERETAAGTGFDGLEALESDLSGFDSYSLTIECNLHGETGLVEVQARFDDRVITAAQTQRLISQFDNVFGQLANEEVQKIHEVQVISEKDIEQIKKWNQTVPDAVKNCIHHVVRGQCERRPNEVAVTAWDGELTYHTLLEHARRLAQHLVGLGVGPEVKVGLCMDKSKWVPVTMLAILEAGGVVVPLGARDPLSRLEAIFRDTQITVAVVDEAQSARLNNLVPHLLSVSDSWLSSLPVEREPATPRALTPDNAAWIIFTSGSTGTPKGVVLEHKALCTSLRAHGDRFNIGPHTRGLQFSAYTFDMSIADTLGVLFHGGKIYIPSEHDRLNRLAAFMAEHQVNFSMLTSTVAGLLSPADIPSLKTLALIGEALKPSVVEAWLGHAVVVNGYGPAECSINASSNIVTARTQALNIGFQLAGRLWVVNSANYQRLCPIGVVGELLIEGPLLSRGYLDDPEKTAAAFITDPAWAAQVGLPPSCRMYRTGDLVQQKEDGSLVYIGRRDTQVKIRGHRVETGEIEYWVTRLLPGVRTAAASLLQNNSRTQGVEQVTLAVAMDFDANSPLASGIDQTKAAKAAPEPLAASDSLLQAFQELRTSLFDVLPSYMVPSAYIPLTRLPLNASGKLDRRTIGLVLNALEPEQTRAFLSTTGTKTTPSTETERQLQSLWASALGVQTDEIGTNDHFFQLGGDSVTAMRVVAAGRTLPAPLAVGDIFQHPYLADLARLVDDRARGGQSTRADHDVPRFALLAGPNDVPAQLEDLAAQCGIAVEQIEDAYPCTPLQEGLMAISTQRPETYMAQRVFRFGAAIDLPRFQEAWETLAKETAILRTRIVPSGHGPAVQVVVREPIRWAMAASLAQYLAADRKTPMAYGGPLVRWALIEEEDDEGQTERYFVWTGHHSTYDGWSVQRMLDSLARVYSGEAPQPAVPFTRFLNYLQGKNSEETARYWQTQLEGANTAQFPSVPHPAYQPRVSKKETRLMADGGRAGTETTSTVLRAAWAIVVAKHIGLDETVLAVTLSGRTAPVTDVAQLLAPTITTVPVRIRIAPEQTVDSYLAAVQRQAADMIPFEHTGLQNIRRMVPASAATLNPGHLFLVQAPVEREDSATPIFSGLEAVESSLDGFDSYALNIECTADGETGKIEVQARFDDEVITPVQVRLLLAQFERVFHQLRNKEVRQIGDVQVVSEEDLSQIKAWNRTIPSALEACIHDVIRTQSEKQPNAMAVSAWDGKLTYQSLWSRSERLAHHLVSLGVRPEVKVGVCMDKSKWAPVAMLAILQAGGTVVPLGTEHPLARLGTIISDAAMTTIVADKAQVSRLAGIVPNLLTVSESWLASLPTPPGPACGTVEPANAAWIIYTSGSTGIPKGVVLEHKALCTSLRAHGLKFNIGRHTRGLQFSAYTFDMSIADTIGILCHGGCTFIPSNEDRLNRLARYMNEMQVNFAMLTSSVAALVTPNEVPSLRTLALIGEAVKPAVVAAWQGHAAVINGYGPAECSINVASNKIADHTQALNIGYPLAGRLWVTDAANYHRLAPIGVAGELLIEGPLLSRGYLNDPQKTASMFITDPEWMEQLGIGKGKRMYRTGDLVRQNLDGSLTYIGRRDTQIKIRGQRVETGEIEHWITRLLPTVRNAAVTVAGLGAEATVEDAVSLVAAVDFFDDSTRAQHKEQKASTEASKILPPSASLREAFHKLRASLSRELPAYMVPHIYVPLANMPLNASGKLDRKAVQELVAGLDGNFLLQYSGEKATSKTVLSPVEAKLRPLLAGLLAIDEDQISPDENIFLLGGDSITIMKLAAAARRHQLTLNIAHIFQSPTLSEIAKSAWASASNAAEPIAHQQFALLDPPNAKDYVKREISPMVDSGSNGILDVMPVTDFQALSVATAFMKGYSELHHFSIVGKGPVDLNRLQSSCFELIRRFDVFRTAFVFNRGKLLQVVLRTYDLDIPVYNTDLPVQALANNLIQTEMKRPPRLGQPMVDVAIVSNNYNSEYCVLFRLTHAVYDGISLPRIWSALGDIYDKKQTQEHPTFSSFMLDRSRRLSKDTYKYWRNLLQGSSIPQLGKFSSPAQQVPLALEVQAPLKVEMADIASEKLTPAIYIKAAWALVVAQYTGSRDVVFGDTVSGRDMADPFVADAVGCCATVIPVRVQFQPSWTAVDLLRCVRDQQLNSAVHGTLGFREIVHECTDWPTSTRFTSFINHAPSEQTSLDLGGCASVVNYVAPKTSTSLFDVSLASSQKANHVEITLAAGKSTIGFDAARELRHQLSLALGCLANHSKALLSQFLGTSGRRRGGTITAAWMERPVIRQSSRSSVPDSQVIRAWKALSGPRRGDCDGNSDCALTFFRIGGDLVDAAEIADRLQQQGYAISLDEVLEHPAFDKMA